MAAPFPGYGEIPRQAYLSPNCLADGEDSPGARKSSSGARLATGRPASIEKGLPPPTGGEATAELSQPTAHNPLAAIHLSWFLRSILILSLEHEAVGLSGR